MKTLALALLLAVPAAAQAPAPAAAAPAGKTQITWLGHAAFEMITKTGTSVLIDPWLGNPTYPADRPKPGKVDLILVTHGHGDHLGDTVDLATRLGATVVGSHELTLWLGAQGVKNVVGLNSGGTFVHKDVTVHAVDAMHSSGISAKDGSVVYGGSALGFVVEPAGGPRLYHAGDTNVFPGMALTGQLYKPDLALLPIGGHYTMGPKEAALAAKLVGAKQVWPMHWGTFPALAGTPDALKAELKAAGTKLEVLTPRIGATQTF